MLPPPGGPASPRTAVTRPGPQRGSRAAGGRPGRCRQRCRRSGCWPDLGGCRATSAISGGHGAPATAYATNPETSAFIAADGWYCVIALIGGALIGLLAYLFAVRRYGPVAMTGAVIGSVAAAFIAIWVGHQASGALGFNAVLATSKPGTYLYAPISLGSHGALAFWPLAAAAVAGGIGLIAMLRERHQASYAWTPMPGIDSFAMRPYSAGRPETGQAQPQATGSPTAGFPALGFSPADFPPAGFPAAGARLLGRRARQPSPALTEAVCTAGLRRLVAIRASPAASGQGPTSQA